MATWPIPTVCLPRSTSMGHRCRIASRAGHTDEQACMCQSPPLADVASQIVGAEGPGGCGSRSSTLQAEMKHFEY